VANTHSIHLVSKLPTKQSLDPADIAAAVLETVRECSQALTDFESYQEALVVEMREQLNHMEVTALRAMAQKVGRS
jgi:hypothetical protein